MFWDRLQASVKQFIAGAPEEPQVSRRDFLAGMGLCGAVGVVASLGLAPSAAEAGILALDSEADEADVIEVWHEGRPHRSRRRRSRRRRRLSARQLRLRCRQSRSFRRRNRNLCRRALGWRGRRGTCIQIGPMRICE